MSSSSAGDLLDGSQFVCRQVAVPAKLAQHAEGELRITVLDLRTDRYDSTASMLSPPHSSSGA
jgi:hypothetical protein